MISGGSAVGLQPQYSLFGQVVGGIELVNEMHAVTTARGDRPTTDLVIESITVAES